MQAIYSLLLCLLPRPTTATTVSISDITRRRTTAAQGIDIRGDCRGKRCVFHILLTSKAMGFWCYKAIVTVTINK
ncbi:hypothetical protein F5B18DRAFT_640360 [Nemania serpens]|nr:hypothetical protein F5B18DRAFT_640360 [Nemania serpens]